MRLHWQPVGPLPAVTYWRRRAGLALVVVLTALALPVMAGGSAPARLAAGPPATPTPAAALSATPTPAVALSAAAGPPSPGASAVAACPSRSLAGQVTTDASTYRPGAPAVIGVRIANNGPVPCRLQVDAGAVEVVVTSGSDRIWSSGDCPDAGLRIDAVLPPGQATTRTVRWPATRSAPGCPRGQPVAQPGTYHATARVGDLQLPDAVFQVG